MRLDSLDEDERRYIGPYLTGSPSQSGEWRGYCVLCENPQTSKSPSASYNFVGAKWHCMKCNAGSSIGRLIRRLKRDEREMALSGNGKEPTEPLPSARQLELWNRRLMTAVGLRRSLERSRGLTRATLKKWRIGYYDTQRRFTIPVYDREGELVNVRLYDPKARGSMPKMLPFATGYGTQLFNPSVLDESDWVILCEGEMDCILLNQHHFPTLTHTGGAGAFQESWAREFMDKEVFIVYDEDAGGRRGAIRTARILSPVAEAVYIVSNLGTGKEGGDVTDYFLSGRSRADFRELLRQAKNNPYKLDSTRKAIPTSGKPVSLEESQSAEIGSEPLELTVMVAGKIPPPYIVPREFVVRCDMAKGKVCSVCPMNSYDGERTIAITPDDHRIMSFIDSNESATRTTMGAMAETRCLDHVVFESRSDWSVEPLEITHSVEHRTEETQQPLMRRLYSVSTYKTPVNKPIHVIAQQVKDPKTNKGILQAWSLEEVQTDIDKFQLTPELVEQLKVFRRARNQSALEKCIEIAHDLSNNVTMIYGREMMHVAYDLVWHSALTFSFRGVDMEKGWLEAIVIGDTRTGKSEAALRLARHYRSGLVKSCEGVSFAGIVGGAEQVSGRSWMVRWGTIPLNDRRLVVLDEVSGMKDRNVIDQMSSIRSMGKAQITKIVADETSARTRLIWLSNPSEGKPLNKIPGRGTEALGKLIENPEDIARFDFAMAVANEDVESAVINAPEHEEVEHTYTSELCNALVLWAWSRRSDQVRFLNGTTEAILEAAEEVGSRYFPDPPLVQVANVRMKIARIAVAFAARTFSTDASAENILVRPHHVNSAVEFLDAIYGAEAMGYLMFSERLMTERQEAKRNKRAVRSYLRENKQMMDALMAVRSSDSFRPRDFEEFGGLQVDSREAVSILLNWKMVRRIGHGRIELEPALLEVLEELEGQ